MKDINNNEKNESKVNKTNSDVGKLNEQKNNNTENEAYGDRTGL